MRSRGYSQIHPHPGNIPHLIVLHHLHPGTHPGHHLRPGHQTNLPNHTHHQMAPHHLHTVPSVPSGPHGRQTAGHLLPVPGLPHSSLLHWYRSGEQTWLWFPHIGHCFDPPSCYLQLPTQVHHPHWRLPYVHTES